MKKLLMAIFIVSLSVTGCENRYTGPILTVDSVNRYLHSVGEDTACLQDGFDSICVKVIPGTRGTQGPQGPRGAQGPQGELGSSGANTPIIHIHDRSIIYEFYYEDKLLLRAEKEMDTTEILAQLTAQEEAEPQEHLGTILPQDVNTGGGGGSNNGDGTPGTRNNGNNGSNGGNNGSNNGGGNNGNGENGGNGGNGNGGNGGGNNGNGGNGGTNGGNGNGGNGGGTNGNGGNGGTNGGTNGGNGNGGNSGGNGGGTNGNGGNGGTNGGNGNGDNGGGNNGDDPATPGSIDTHRVYPLKDGELDTSKSVGWIVWVYYQDPIPTHRGTTIGTSGFGIEIYVDGARHPDINADTSVVQVEGSDDMGGTDYSIQFFVSSKAYEGQTPAAKIEIRVTGLLSANLVSTFTLPNTVTPEESTFQDDPLEPRN